MNNKYDPEFIPIIKEMDAITDREAKLMILDIIQTSKELVTADFIVKHGEKQVGSFSLKGSFHSMEADIKGVLYNRAVFFMTRHKAVKSKEKEHFRPYSILECGKESGLIFQAERKISLFKGYGYYEMNCYGNTYTMYAIGMGSAGAKFPIYCENTQVAQIEKDCVVYDGLHNYRVYIKQDNLVDVVVWLCAYLYVTGQYTPGEKIIRGKTKAVSTTTNGFLKEKYNPEFINSVKE